MPPFTCHSMTDMPRMMVEICEKHHFTMFCPFAPSSTHGKKYTSSPLYRDLIAGITVGIIAIPLAMALAVAAASGAHSMAVASAPSPVQ